VRNRVPTLCQRFWTDHSGCACGPGRSPVVGSTTHPLPGKPPRLRRNRCFRDHQAPPGVLRFAGEVGNQPPSANRLRGTVLFDPRSTSTFDWGTVTSCTGPVVPYNIPHCCYLRPRAGYAILPVVASLYDFAKSLQRAFSPHSGWSTRYFHTVNHVRSHKQRRAVGLGTAAAPTTSTGILTRCLGHVTEIPPSAGRKSSRARAGIHQAAGGSDGVTARADAGRGRGAAVGRDAKRAGGRRVE
jgi:hypothetical protein